MKALIADAEEAIILAPFWGHGAVNSLGLTKRHSNRLKIVCNLESGSCNPFEIKKIQNLGIEVLTNHQLHAKIFWTANSMLVGSSNVSANGLGFEGPEVKFNLEANIEVRDPACISQTHEWIMHVREKSQTLTTHLMDAAMVAWRRRRNTRLDLVVDKRKNITLLDALREDRSRFKDRRIFLWAYNTHAGPESNEDLEKQKISYGSDLQCYELLKKYADSYQPGDYIIDVWHDYKDTSFSGIYKLLELPKRKTVKSYFNVFCIKVSRIDELKVTAAERAKLVSYVKSKWLLNEGAVVDEEEEFYKIELS